MGRAGKIAIVVVLAVAVVAVIVSKRGRPPAATDDPAKATAQPKPGIPRLLDLGAGKCIPCKMMAPILEGLKKEYQGRLQVDVVDVSEDRATADRYQVSIIPTQIFFDAAGKELFRHEGFIPKDDILAKWKKLGVDLGSRPTEIIRETPLVKDERPRDRVCFMCDGDVAPKTRVSVHAKTGDVVLCSPHCFFIYYSSLWDTAGVDEKTTVTDWLAGGPLPAPGAAYLYGVDGRGRPTVKAFADKGAASRELAAAGGSILGWETLRTKELAVRCAFCSRANYPEDACSVKVGTAQMYACCPMCALGVAARLQQDIEVEVKDALNSQPVRVQTWDGNVRSLEPTTSVAWHGQKKGPGGTMASAGCFKQFFFVSEANLKQWLEAHPEATGKMVTIARALADKMKLTPDQIRTACKIGECPPTK